MSAQTVILTGVGQDRVGIVAELAQIFYERGCNLLDSSMTLLRGEFALILMISLPDGESTASLQEDLSALEARLGLTMHMRELTDDELAEAESPVNSYIVSVYGADKPGIVAGITSKLAKAQINITDVQTKSTTGASSVGSLPPAPLFQMILEVNAPITFTQETLLDLLVQSSKDLDVDISVQALESAEL